MFNRLFILSIILIFLSFIKCAPVYVSVSDSIQPFINNRIDIIKIDTITTSYGSEKMYKIYYKDANR
jgi:hypothetical protein